MLEPTTARPAVAYPPRQRWVLDAVASASRAGPHTRRDISARDERLRLSERTALEGYSISNPPLTRWV